MKNKGLIIFLIILSSIIIFSLVMFLVAYLRGEINFKNWVISLGPKNTDVIYDEQFDFEDIKNIEIRQDAGEIILKETSNEYIQVVIYGERLDDVKIDLSSGNLNIDYTYKNKISLFNFGWNKNDIIVYIPSDYSNEIKIKNNFGNCEIGDLKNSIINIKSNAGNVNIVRVKDVVIKCDYGDVEVEEILNKCNIESDCGNIEINKLFIKEDSIIKSDLGNIDISQTSEVYIDADVDLGKVNINKNDRSSEVTLKIKADCGNVTVNN